MATKTATRKTTKRAPSKAAADKAPAYDVAAIHDQFAAQVEALRSSDEWTRMLRFAASFHTYSPTNMLMILMQCPDATRVTGYRKWLPLGRQVRKGEKSIRIWAPRMTKADVPADAPADEQGKDRLRFVLVPVFDIGQTDPIEGVDDLTAVAAGPTLDGADDADIYGRVAAHLTGMGWTVTRDRIHGGADGYSTASGTKQVVIDDRLSPAAAASVILHEAAHVVLGHCDAPSGDYAAHRGAWETAAESVAYIMATLLGLDTAASSVHYVAGWADGPDGADAIRATLADVMKAVKALSASLLPVEAQVALAA